MTAKTQLITHVCTVCGESLRSPDVRVYNCDCGGYFIPQEAIDQINGKNPKLPIQPKK